MTKYNAKKTVIDGIKFDSLMEGRRYSQLKQQQDKGLISLLETHPKFPIIINDELVRVVSPKRPNGTKVSYYADFRYLDNESLQIVVEDVKGMDTPVSKLKRALVKSIYGIDVVVKKA